MIDFLLGILELVAMTLGSWIERVTPTSKRAKIMTAFAIVLLVSSAVAAVLLTSS